MNSHLKSLLFIFTIITIALTAHADNSVNRSELFKTADEKFYLRADPANANEALRLYRQIYSKDSQDAEAGWRLSMACYFVGFEFTSNNDEKKKLFAEGRDAGLASAELNPGSAPAHFWAAINMALYGQVTGPVKMLFTLSDICRHLNETIKIDSTYAYGGAYRVLGAINESLPYILGGREEEAGKYYEKAIKACPDEPLNYYFLAKFLDSRRHNRKAAIDTARRGLLSDNIAAGRYESHKAIKELRKFLNEREH